MMLFLRILETLLPIVLLVGLGAALFKAGFLQSAHRAVLDKLVYWVCLPSLLVIKIAEAGAITASIGWVILAMCALTVVAAGVGVLVWGVCSRERSSFGVVVQAAFRGNLAFVGLPVIELAGADDRTLATAALTLAPTIALYNLLAVPALTVPHQTADPEKGLGAMLAHSLRSLATNPFILACVLGLVFGLLRLDEIEPLAQTLTLVGQPAAPLALMSLGGALTIYRVHDHLGLALSTTAVKLGVSPALAVVLAWMMGLDQQQACALIMLAATPTAVASYVLVTQLKGDEGLAASIIATTTLACPLSLAAGLAVVEVWGG